MRSSRRRSGRSRALARAALLFAILVAPLSAPPAAAGPITTNNALPVAENELIFRGQAKLLRASKDPSSLDRELTVWAAPTVLVYGATDRLALFGIFPYLDKSLRVTTPVGRRTRGDRGLGDLRFLARYTVAAWDFPGETLRLAPFVGIEVPTGDDDERDSLGKLPGPLQLRSGSFDPILGAVFTWQTFAWELDTQAVYKINTEAGGFALGDVARFDLSLQVRIWPWTFRDDDEAPAEGDSSELSFAGEDDAEEAETALESVPTFCYAVLESNLIWQDRNEVSGARDRDSGGWTWYLAPGLQVVTKRLVVEMAVQLPPGERPGPARGS